MLITFVFEKKFAFNWKDSQTLMISQRVNFVNSAIAKANLYIMEYKLNNYFQNNSWQSADSMSIYLRSEVEKDSLCRAQLPITIINKIKLKTKLID